MDFHERGIMDRDEQRSQLDPVLLPLYDHLMESQQQLQDLSEQDIAREVEATAYRLRSQHDKTELARLQVMLRDTDEDRTPEEEQSLLHRVAHLRKRMGENQKALGRLTLLGSGRLNARGSIR